MNLLLNLARVRSHSINRWAVLAGKLRHSRGSSPCPGRARLQSLQAAAAKRWCSELQHLPACLRKHCLSAGFRSSAWNNQGWWILLSLQALNMLCFLHGNVLFFRGVCVHTQNYFSCLGFCVCSQWCRIWMYNISTCSEMVLKETKTEFSWTVNKTFNAAEGAI